jgi:hypothetical protein
VVTEVDPVVAPAAADWLFGAIENEHPAVAAACVTVNVCPPMVNVPMRCVVFGFAIAV